MLSSDRDFTIRHWNIILGLKIHLTYNYLHALCGDIIYLLCLIIMLVWLVAHLHKYMYFVLCTCVCLCVVLVWSLFLPPGTPGATPYGGSFQHFNQVEANMRLRWVDLWVWLLILRRDDWYLDRCTLVFPTTELLKC